MSRRADREAVPTLRSTNVNTPQIRHHHHHPSVSADQHLFHDDDIPRPPSTESNDALLEAMQRFSTPPSSPGTPAGIVGTDTTTTRDPQLLPSTQAAMMRLQADGTNDAQPTTQPERTLASIPEASQPARAPEDSRIKRKPVGSGSSFTRYSQINPDPGPPTPGVDDANAIQFAIDQLTRDEEVRGSRQYPGGIRATFLEDQAGGRTLYSEGPGKTIYEEPSNLENEKSTRLATDRPTERAVASESATYPPLASRNLQPNATLEPEPNGGPQEQPSNYTLARETQARQTPEPFERNPQSSRDAIMSSPEPRLERDQLNRSDAYVPMQQDIVPLYFIPGILRPLWLFLYIFLIVLTLVGLGFSGGWSANHLGLYRYTQFGGSRYFVFQYLPTICAMVLLVWQFQIQVAIKRIAPFMAMASQSAKSRSEAPLLEMQPTNFLIPDFRYFSAGQPVIGSCMIVFWLQIFNPPLITCLYNVYFFGALGSGQWRWDTVQGIVWTLFALYLLQLFALAAVAFVMWRARTGLKWDPRSIADLVALLDRSNVVHDYAGTETAKSRRFLHEHLGHRSDRLGFWTTSTRPNDIFYGIGEEGGPTRLFSHEDGRLTEKQSRFASNDASAVHLESGEEFDRVRYRYLPWYLKPVCVAIWSVLAIGFYLAFLVVSYVNNAVIDGFNPQLRVAPDSAGFSATNFLYSFIPALLAQLLFLAWLSVDYAFRRLQPFAAMSATPTGHSSDLTTSSDSNVNFGPGASAQDSLLLDYPARLPFSVTFAALASRDIRIAWFSFMSLIAACLPVFAGGCFWAQFYTTTQSTRVAVDPSAYYAMCVFLGLYAFTIPLIFIGLRKRKLPHDVVTIAELTSFLYASRILGERDWRAPLGSKTEMVARLVSAVTERERNYDQAQGSKSNRYTGRNGGRLTSGGEGRFSFGRFVGRDGKVHLGIERIGRGDQRRGMSERTWRKPVAGGYTTRSRSSSGNVLDAATQPERAFDEKAASSNRQPVAQARHNESVARPSADSDGSHYSDRPTNQANLDAEIYSNTAPSRLDSGRWLVGNATQDVPARSGPGPTASVEQQHYGSTVPHEPLYGTPQVVRIPAPAYTPTPGPTDPNRNPGSWFYSRGANAGAAPGGPNVNPGARPLPSNVDALGGQSRYNTHNTRNNMI